MKALSIKRLIAFLVCAVICTACAIVSIYFYKPHKRFVYYFYSYSTDGLCTEVRHSPVNAIQGDVSFFIEELLLGPMTNRYKKLFADGTTLEFCIQKDDVLYVGLSKDALFPEAGDASIKDGVEALKVNIVKQFTKINTILVYIDGKSVFWEG